MSRETELTGRQCALLRAELANSVVIKHTDLLTADVPDFSVTWAGGTIWFEGKILQPVGNIKGKKSQLLQMQRLAKMGSAWYIVWNTITPRFYETHIVHPSEIDPEMFIKSSKVIRPGLDYACVAAFIREQIQGRRYNHHDPYGVQE